MKRTIYTLITCIVMIMTSCSSDDDNNDNNNPVIENSLSGTVWYGTDDDEGEVYTFTSAMEFTFSGDGPTHSGTYTFNGSAGVLHHTDGNFNFEVSGDILSVDNGNSSIYVKQ
ncbi:MAG: hypothetical protein ACK5M1_12740 [Xanthomarina gelatinilytica]|uniref:hypothetical protein n=1 Tax=Xanthomarina gelatinilytica TaxID=1137281 RepID=UPI003A89321E